MKALVTAGPTYEHIDPVRFIGNHSSGKMGIELAEELIARGYEVILVIGPTHLTCSDKINRIDVVSADEMYEACVKVFPSCDLAIMSAAVADYKVANISDKKIKRNGDSLTIELIPNKDIAAELGKMKSVNQKIIGFALETNDGVDNAIRKIQSKNLDMIVLNQIGEKGVGFKSDTNKITTIKYKNKGVAARGYSNTMLTLQDSLKLYMNCIKDNPFSGPFYQGLIKNAEKSINECKSTFFDIKDFDVKSKADVAKDIVDSI